MIFYYLKFCSILSWRNSSDLKRNYWWVIWSFFSLFLLQFWFWQILDKASEKKKALRPSQKLNIFGANTPMNNWSNNFSVVHPLLINPCQLFWRAVKVKVWKLCVAGFQCRLPHYGVFWLREQKIRINILMEENKGNGTEM